MGFGDFVKKALKASNIVFGDGVSRQVQHGYRLAEMAQESQYQKAQLELRDNQNRELQAIMHELRIDLERARRRMENSPFFQDDLDTAELLWQKFKEQGKPLFLVSPFWDETKTNTAADAGGGDSHFRTVIRRAWHEFQYISHGVCLDGIFKRPLRQTDMDILWICNVLKDLPIILAYGYTDGKSIFPMIATWNVLPNTAPNQIIQIHGNALLPSDQNDDEFRQHIGQAMIGAAGAVMGITGEGRNLYGEARARLLAKPKDMTAHNQNGARTMSNHEITHVIGFDFGDSETALAQVVVNAGDDNPKEIFCNLANNNTGIIQTVVGYKKDGQILVGHKLANFELTELESLHVGFKVMPERGDQDYKRLATDFINHVFEHLCEENIVDLRISKVIIGHPSRWKHVKGGEPVEIMNDIIGMTKIGRESQFELVPESRGAMLEGIKAGLFAKASQHQSGWVLVVDMGSSTSDFTAVNISQKTSAPVDYGEEIGARLIDRAIAQLALQQHKEKDRLCQLFNDAGRAQFELFCREMKERYYSGQDRALGTFSSLVGENEYIFIPVVLTKETMRTITCEYPLVKINGEHLTWRDGFKKTLQQVKKDLKKSGIDDIRAILLTGGASRMDFIADVCKEVFPELNSAIARSPKPSFDIANGLARWGRLQIQTDQFTRDIDIFCDQKIKGTVETHVDKLYTMLSRAIADHLIAIIKGEFDKWKSGRHTTISVMNIQIERAIKQWLDVQLPSEIAKISGIWVNEITPKLSVEIQEVEIKYKMRASTLGKSFSVSTLKDHKVKANVNIKDIDVTDGTSDLISSISALIAGIISAVITLKVTAIIVAIAYNVTALTVSALISTLVTGLLAASLTPVGLIAVAVVVGSAILAGVNMHEYLKNKIPDLDLPRWVRDMVKTSSIHDKISGKHSDIVNEILKQMRGQEQLRSDIVRETTAKLADSLKETAEEARMLIS
jgi:hypothetical protein